eukprot:jgi/Picsp_1/4714/NSC_02083-R1_hypothetical protein CHLNCDRAFT_137647 [Chlorella variabilis]
MKVAKSSLHVSFCDARDCFALIWGDPSFLRQYHESVNGDCDAQVPQWVDNWQRQISFTMPINAPSIVMRLIGADTITVLESQRVRFDLEDGGSIRLESDPKPQIPGADRFSSVSCVQIRDCAEVGCMIEVEVSCSATGPYGLVGTIEHFMSETAKTSVDQLLLHCQKYLEALRNNNELYKALGVARTLIPVLSMKSIKKDGEERSENHSNPGDVEQTLVSSRPGSAVFYDLDGDTQVYNTDVIDKLEKMSQAQESLLKELTRLSQNLELLVAHSAVPQRFGSGHIRGSMETWW